MGRGRVDLGSALVQRTRAAPLRRYGLPALGSAPEEIESVLEDQADANVHSDGGEHDPNPIRADNDSQQARERLVLPAPVVHKLEEVEAGPIELLIEDQQPDDAKDGRREERVGHTNEEQDAWNKRREAVSHVDREAEGLGVGVAVVVVRVAEPGPRPKPGRSDLTE